MEEEEKQEEREEITGGGLGKAYAVTPEAATDLQPPVFNRKKPVMVLSLAFVAVIGGGLLVNTGRGGKKKDGPESRDQAARAPSEYLRSQRDRALSGGQAGGSDGGGPVPEIPDGNADAALVPAAYRRDGGGGGEEGLPAVFLNDDPPPSSGRPDSRGDGRTEQTGGGGGGRTSQTPVDGAYRSPLVPRTVEGSLFKGARTESAAAGDAGRTPYSGAGQAAADAYLRQVLAAQSGAGAGGESGAGGGRSENTAFYDPANGGAGAPGDGRFPGENSLWIGTVIPGVLETGINTDLPGNVLARVTRNIYDSRTGKNLLVPQGTVLVARYNSSVSYAQRRVQIVWDTLIRPDGWELELGGMNAVDREGMSGQEAEYHENWFEYLKAAALITVFSVAASKMNSEAAKYASSDTAGGIAQANAEFVGQTGANIVSRAMDIQPTLTVENGAVISIMLNKTLYLPPLDDYPAEKKYTLR